MLYSVIDSVLDEQVVIDSTSAPNYQAWQTNAEGPGLKVMCLNDCLLFDSLLTYLYLQSTVVNYNLRYFDLTNPDDVLNGAKPIVTEVGPYAYREFFRKFDIE